MLTPERIAKKIAKGGKYSRRKAEDLIKSGKVEVNNKIISTPNFLVTDSDIIKINGKSLKIILEVPKLWLLNKPKGILTTKKDPKGRPTIYNLLPVSLQHALYVGRLDFNSEGLLLLSNSGELVNYLTSAKNNIKRVYQVKTFGKIKQEQLDKLKKGIVIHGTYYRKIDATIIKQNNLQTWISFALLEGKNNEIRNICKSLGLQVSHLVRTSFGPFVLNKLNKGETKEISIKQLKKLFPFLFKKQEITSATL